MLGPLHPLQHFVIWATTTNSVFQTFPKYFQILSIAKSMSTFKYVNQLTKKDEKKITKKKEREKTKKKPGSWKLIEMSTLTLSVNTLCSAKQRRLDINTLLNTTIFTSTILLIHLGNVVTMLGQQDKCCRGKASVSNNTTPGCQIFFSFGQTTTKKKKKNYCGHNQMQWANIKTFM